MAGARQPGGAPAADVVIVGAGARRPGAKILVSGGGQCNVTNRDVTERDFCGGRRAIIRWILKAFTSADAERFFGGLGVHLHEEHDGKLFPDSGRARDVLGALLKGAETVGGQIARRTRVLSVERCHDGLRVLTAGGTLHAGFVVLATGGQSLPKSGSNGAGFDFVRRLGHRIVPTTAALVPLVFAEVRTHFIHRIVRRVRRRGACHPGRWADIGAAVRITAVDAFRHQRPSCIERVPPLAQGGGRGAARTADRQLLARADIRCGRALVARDDERAAADVGAHRTGRTVPRSPGRCNRPVHQH